MPHLTREELNAGLKKQFGSSVNAHPAVQIFPVNTSHPAVSSLSKEMLIAGPRQLYSSSCQLYVVRYTGLASRPYVAQSWTTGIDHPFTSIGALKAFMLGKTVGLDKPAAVQAEGNTPAVGAEDVRAAAMTAENIRPNIKVLDEGATRSGLPTYSELVETLRRVQLRAVRQQAAGGDVHDFQDRLRECGDDARAILARLPG